MMAAGIAYALVSSGGFFFAGGHGAFRLAAQKSEREGVMVARCSAQDSAHSSPAAVARYVIGSASTSSR